MQAAESASSLIINLSNGECSVWTVAMAFFSGFYLTRATRVHRNNIPHYLTVYVWTAGKQVAPVKCVNIHQKYCYFVHCASWVTSNGLIFILLPFTTCTHHLKISEMMCFSQSRRNSASVSPAQEDLAHYKGRHNHSVSSPSPVGSAMSVSSIDDMYRGGHRHSSRGSEEGKIFLRRQQGTNIFHDEFGNEVPQVSWKVPVSIIDPTLNYHTSIGRMSRMSPANHHPVTRSRINSTRNAFTSRSKSRNIWQNDQNVDDDELDTFSIESMTSLERYVEDIGLSDSEDEDKTMKATEHRKHSRNWRSHSPTSIIFLLTLSTLSLPQCHFLIHFASLFTFIVPLNAWEIDEQRFAMLAPQWLFCFICDKWNNKLSLSIHFPSSSTHSTHLTLHNQHDWMFTLAITVHQLTEAIWLLFHSHTRRNHILTPLDSHPAMYSLTANEWHLKTTPEQSRFCFDYERCLYTPLYPVFAV